MKLSNINVAVPALLVLAILSTNGIVEAATGSPSPSPDPSQGNRAKGGAMALIVEDFEDFGSWRTWALNSGQPAGERVYGENLWLCGVRDPERAWRGQGVGEVRYWFGDGEGIRRLWAKRAVVSEVEASIDAIRFHANAQDFPCDVSFELLDKEGGKFRTGSVRLEGSEWREYTIPVAGTPAVAGRSGPFRIEHFVMEAGRAGKGDVLLDDIAILGTVDPTRRLQIKRVYTGMTYDPSQSLVVSYELRNALDREIEFELVAELFRSTDPEFREPVATRTERIRLAGHSAAQVPVAFGKVETGHYLARLRVESPEIEVQELDPVAVMQLNGRRINESPMWFGSMHPGSWLARPENEFVLREFIVPLGLDCYRTGAPDKALLDAGLLVTAGFGSVPPHLRKPGEEYDHRGEPNDYEAYYEWVKDEARKRYLPHKDRIISVEFYNEPDLPNFEYHPGIDTYLKMHEVFRRAFREVIPDVRIGTGGNTVAHGKEKPDFNRRMYTELAKEADVAIWHAHGPLQNYMGLQRKVEQWLEAGGRVREEMLLGNSESGEPSGTTPEGWIRQADTLVRKIGWAKAQPNSLFFIWFTTTDTYDPQGGYLGGENWGLINFRQRIKASGQAYNELIRQLANTAGEGEVHFDARLQTCRYKRPNGASVWLSWPHERGATFVQPLRATGPVVLTDLFGNRREIQPRNERLILPVNGYPFYLEAAAGVEVGAAPKPENIHFPELLGGLPGDRMRLPVQVKGAAGQAVTVRLLDGNGKVVSEATKALPDGGAGDFVLAFDLPENIPWGQHGYAVLVAGGPEEELLPLTVVVAQAVPRINPLKITDATWDLPESGRIVLDSKGHVQELAFDPSTPYWDGPEDLSVDARFAHDGEAFYAVFAVRDAAHFPGETGEKLWNADSIQMLISSEGRTTQLGMTEAGGGAGWCWVSTHGDLASKPLKQDYSVTREGDITTYRIRIPFNDLAVDYRPGMPLRLAFVVNEADSAGGRVRALRWFDGILTGGGVDKAGHLMLE